MGSPTYEYIRPNVTSYQRAIMDSPARFTIVIAATKTGKTVSHIFWLFEQALTGGKGKNYWWVAPVYSQAKVAYRRLKEYLDASFYTASESELTITLFNGSVISFKSAEKYDNLYGEDVYAVVMDEFTRARIEAWFAIRSTTTATRGRIKMIGNYISEANWGSVLARKKANDPDFEFFKITIDDAVACGLLTQDVVERARGDLPRSTFMALYYCISEDGRNRIFSSEGIVSLFSNSHVQTENAKYYMTCDIATRGKDLFVLMVWHGWTVVEVISIERTSGANIVQVMNEIKKEYGIMASNIIYDADGVGSGISGFIKGAIEFHNNGRPIGSDLYANLKTQCYTYMGKKVNDGQVYFAIDDDQICMMLSQELEAATIEPNTPKVSITPKDKIKSYIGRSPDYSDAFSLRAWFELLAPKRFRRQTAMGS